MNYTPQERCEKILTMGHKLLDWLAENQITSEQIENDYVVQWTITTPLYNIGEQTYQLAKEWKEQYPDIPWSQISGIRHRLVHNYEDTNWKIISYVLFEELEKFLEQLEDVLRM